MPLVQKKEIENVIIGVWKISESINEFLNIVDLDNEEKTILNLLHNNNRKLQFLATRALTNSVIKTLTHIHYTNTGKPVLINNRKISISHSGIWVGVIISDFDVGIDVELKKNRIKKIKHKYLSDNEISCVDNDDLKALLLYWCAKEVMVKITDNKSYSFKKELFIKPFITLDIENVFYGYIKQKTFFLPLTFNYFEIENLLVVWSINKT